MKTILKTISILFFTLLAMTGCYNDDLVWQELEKHEQRISKLENMCQKFNWDIYEMQNVIKAIKERDYLISVTSTQNQYVLLFAEAGKIVINKHSEGNEHDVSVPAIGVKHDSDGNWYWTLSGEWLTDQNGERIRANGTDGQDGNKGLDAITPKFKIKDGYWMISYDDGKTWELIGDATGENGKDGDSFFKDVKVTDIDVTLILADGTSVVIPRQSTDAALVDIIFSDMGVGMTPGSTRQVNFTLANADENTLVKAVAQNGWRVKVAMTSVSEGYLTVTAPDPMEEDEIIVFVYDGNGRTIMKTINFVTGVISVSMETKSVSGRASEFSVDLETNLDVDIEVPSVAGSWITCQTAPTKAMNKMTCTFSVTDNFSGSTRTASVLIKDRNSSWSKEINIAQAINDYLDFKDPAFQKYLVENFDTNNDGEINKNEAPSITSIKAENKGITSLEGISSLEALESLDVSGNALSKIDLSADVFWKLKDIDCSDNNITEMDISGCRFFLENLKITGNPKMTLSLLKEQGAREFEYHYYPTLTYHADDYQSTDFSKHKTVVTLQEHSVGNGIPILFMGEAYTDRDIESGVYDLRMRQAMEHLFSEEPYKTFRNRFDVKYIILVSQGRTLDGKSTALNVIPAERTTIDYDSYLNSSETIKYELNKLAYNQYNVYSCVAINIFSQDIGQGGVRACYCSTSDNTIERKTRYRGGILHELGGHHIADLGDEYTRKEYATETLKNPPANGLKPQNLSATNDATKVPWSKFLELEDYKDIVGIYEGGYEYYGYGVWRSSENSVMRHDYETTKFNAVCRHIIYKKIMELSGEEYSWEAFLEYDKKNLADSPK